MNLTLTIFFLLGMAGGGFYGWLFLHSTAERLFSFFVGGFIGSSTGALFFIYAYFSSSSHTHIDDDDSTLQDIRSKSQATVPSTKLTSLPESTIQNQSAGEKDDSLTGQPLKLSFFKKWKQSDSRPQKIKKLERELRKLKQKQK